MDEENDSINLASISSLPFFACVILNTKSKYVGQVHCDESGPMFLRFTIESLMGYTEQTDMTVEFASRFNTQEFRNNRFNLKSTSDRESA